MIFKRESAKFLLSLAAILVFTTTIDAVLAQAYPFSNPEGAQMRTTSGGALASILATQSEYYRQFCGLVRAAGGDDGVVWGFIGLSFLYGVFQATGPEHRAAISSYYPVANLETWRRGLAWAFASALLQATVAVALVAFLSALLRATAITMGFTVDLVELVSYALIMLIGLRLLFVKGRRLFTMLRQVSPLMFEVGAAITPLPYYHHANCDDRHNRAAQPHDTPHAEGGRKHHREYGGPATYHAHVPRPVEFAAPNGSKRALPTAFAVWVSPWSGTILVLIFALAQGLFWVGVTATFMMGAGSALTMAVIATIAVKDSVRAARSCNARTRYGVLARRGIELGAAVAILAFGTLLLTGCMVSERLIAV
jgi:nickel/cobalt exporter